MHDSKPLRQLIVIIVRAFLRLITGLVRAVDERRKKRKKENKTVHKETRTKETGNDVHELSGINAASCRSRRDNTNLNDQTRLGQLRTSHPDSAGISQKRRKQKGRKKKKRKESHACSFNKSE